MICLICNNTIQEDICNICKYNFDIEDYPLNNNPKLLFKLIDKRFKKGKEYYDVTNQDIFSMYIDYERQTVHEIMLLDERLEKFTKIVTSYLNCRNNKLWTNWRSYQSNKLYNSSILQLHICNQDNIWRGYLPIDCCRLIYSYLHINYV